MLKEQQWLILAGGFTNGQLVNVIEHTGVRERPELFTTHEESDTRILLHTIDLATAHSRIIVRCDDTDVLVLLIYYCGKGMFANCKVFMHDGHCSKTTNRQRFIPVNETTSKIGQDVSIRVTCYQRLIYNAITIQNRQANCIQHTRRQHRTHAVFGRARPV